jgi:hypothetical protein
MFDNPAFMLYAMECEGDIDTQAGRRNKMLKNLRQLAIWSPIDESDVAKEAAAAGLEILTDQEIEDILNEVNGY